MRWQKLAVFAVLIGSSITLGCGAAEDRLAPAAEANKLEDMPNTAQVNTQGVLVRATVDEWPDVAEVKTEITPVHLIIENHSGKPLRAQFQQLALIGEQGQHFAALPPFKIKGEVERPVAVYEAEPLAPSWTQSGFAVYPYYRDIYPNMVVSSEPFFYDPVYYDQFYSVWERIKLPTPNMVRYALPEGVIADAGRIEGFVYFQRIRNKTKRVELEYTLVDAKTGETFGLASIPFVVR